MPNIEGFPECWGISVIHCPYCHGYEVRNERTGILANGDHALHYAQLILNWTTDLTIFTNGRSTLTPEQHDKITGHHIPVIEKRSPARSTKTAGFSRSFSGRFHFGLKAIYSRPGFEQHCPIPEMLGCELTEQGLIKTDMFQQPTVAGVFACGDNTSPMRSVAHAVAAGNIAGAVVNNQLTEALF